MNFKQWLEKEIKLYNSLDLTEEGKNYLNILNKIQLISNNDDVEKLLRKNIKSNINKEYNMFIYREFLIYEGFIEEDEI